MLIRIRSFEVEITQGALFIHLPFIGQAFINPADMVRGCWHWDEAFVSWRTLKATGEA